ncbi:unnamed protein product [Medioppia subpectinata]|uniref:Uncharacterized protein n=1 Tax=Medioppia subpectinata TaxID=1979941 RepID=A0A7R9KTX9_9ACAR|nr:unnamed protein product [Medioppia subpectinata]CAG2109759.1 unnamed protein product [Medioppia subpectinata]
MANWKVLTITSVTIGVCGLVLMITLFTATGGYVPFDYGVVLDAGSSHTQITLYHWKADKERCTGVVEQLDTCRIEGGISGYNVSDPSGVGQDLIQCIYNVSTKIDKDRKFMTPLYLGSTAGMRLLNITAPDKVKLIFKLIRDAFLLSSGLQVQCTDIISGQNEGLFSWVTNNYLMNKLVVDRFDGHQPNSTIGMLDMGGASAQIAYRAGDSVGGGVGGGGLTKNVTDDDVNVRLYGINHTVRASSNLCFGVDQAMLRYQMYLIVTHPERIDPTIDSPCTPIGSQITVPGSVFRDQICAKTKKSINYDRNYTFSGISYDRDGNDCSALISNHLLNTNECRQTFDMCFETEAGPPPQATQFYALSSYYYTVRILNLTVTTADEYRQKTDAFCRLNRDAMLQNPLVVAKYVDVYCFQLNYIYNTIKNVYRFPDNQWPNIRFSNSIKDTTLGWSLGFMINATNAIAAEKPTPPVVELFPFTLVCIFCSLILAFSIYFGIKWHKTNESQRKEQYEPISISS